LLVLYCWCYLIFLSAEKLTHASFSDWGPKIDVVGFCFLDLASDYEPPEPLLRWLESGDKAIYIDFGSIVSVYIVLKTNAFCFFYFLLLSASRFCALCSAVFLFG
jgi:hypothetical protein